MKTGADKSAVIKNWSAFGKVFFLILLGAVQIFSQKEQSNIIVSPSEDYLIGSRDVLDIKVEDAPEISGVFQLNSKGAFILPVVGQITADKKTVDVVAKEIGDKLRGKYLMNPIVTVSVKQSNSRGFYIQGAVRQPGVYQIEGHPSLLKLITIAGGLTENYGSTAYIIKERKTNGEGKISSITDVPENSGTNGKPETSVNKVENTNISQSENDQNDEVSDPEKDDKYEVSKANISNLLRGNFDQNVIINPGDIVHIPTGDIFFVAGEVKAPGSFPLKNGTSLRQAISLAQGTNFQGNLTRSIIFRENPRSGKREEVMIDIAAIMSGKKEDIDILPNDVIMVPNSQKKTIINNILKPLSNSIPGLLLRGLGIF